MKYMIKNLFINLATFTFWFPRNVLLSMQVSTKNGFRIEFKTGLQKFKSS